MSTGSTVSTAEQPVDAVQFWEERYRGASPIWSGAANRALVEVVASLKPGRALDLGCGEGGDAIWFAEQGWQVTAVDISPTATARGAEAAAERGVAESIEWVAHDLTTWETDQHFDLVTASFFHSAVELHRLEILRRASDRLRPGGHLLLVTHVFETDDDIPPWGPQAAKENAHAHDHDHGHSVHTMPTPAEELEQLALDPAHWEVALQEIRPREITSPDGTQIATIKDGVLLLRRRG